jgi:hypothetical protein
MDKIEIRTYNCKDEELIPICGYVAFSFKRDLKEFTAFSPKFDETYAEMFEGKIAGADKILNTKIVTADLKEITTRLYANITKVLDLANRTESYIKMADKALPKANFELAALRKKARNRDAEGTVQAIKITLSAINKHRAAFAAQGMTDAFVNEFEVTMNSITVDNQKQYEIISSRKELVEQNVGLFNDLYLQMSTICKVGKTLFKGKNAIKTQEYTFTELKKRVRIVTKEKKEKE